MNQVTKKVKFSFALLIGIYAILRALKDSLFIELVGIEFIPISKTCSLLVIPLLLLLYEKVKFKWCNRRILLFLSIFYTTLILTYGILLHSPLMSLPHFARPMGFAWYISMECFGSLVMGLFWALIIQNFSSDRFSTLTLMGNAGGICLPFIMNIFISCIGEKTQTAILFFLLLPCILFYFLILKMPHKEKKANRVKISSKEKTSLLLLFRQYPFAIGILAIYLLQGTVLTLLEYLFKCYASKELSSYDLSRCFCLHLSLTSAFTMLLCFLQTRKKRNSSLSSLLLIVTPLLSALGIIICIFFPKVQTFLFLTALLKSTCYALVEPNMKSFYTPIDDSYQSTLHNWVDIAGIRLSKQMGTLSRFLLDFFNSFISLPMSLILFCFPLIALWIKCIQFTRSRIAKLATQ